MKKLIILAIVIAVSLIGCVDADDLKDGEKKEETTPMCGNGVWTASEACDGNKVPSCASEHGTGTYTGTITCSNTCTLIDSCQLVGDGEECGDGVVEGNEACDGTNHDGQTCESLGYDGGSLGCNNCQLNKSNCFNNAPDPSCGNGVAESGENCDGNDMANQSCQSLGYDGGSLTCTSSCAFNRINCYNDAPQCGDSSSDECSENQTANCSAANSNWEGTITCSDSCNWDTSACSYVSNPTSCGNGTKDFSEACDDTNFGGVTCELLGHTGGSLACADDCSNIIETGCTDDVVDNDIVCLQAKNNYSLWGLVSDGNGESWFNINPGDAICGRQIKFNGHNGSRYIVGYEDQCSVGFENYDMDWGAIRVMVDETVAYVSPDQAPAVTLPLNYNVAGTTKSVHGNVNYGIVADDAAGNGINLVIGEPGNITTGMHTNCTPGDAIFYWTNEIF